MSHNNMTRAQFLRMLLAGAGSVALGSLLQACGSGSGVDGAGGSNNAGSSGDSGSSGGPGDGGSTGGSGLATTGPLVQWSALTMEEISTAWPGFVQPLPPNFDPAAPIIETSLGNLAATARDNPGRQIRVIDSNPTGGTQVQSATDVEILIPDSAAIGYILLEDGCVRVRVRGEGPNSRLGVGGLSGTHTTLHSLLLTGLPGWAEVLDIHDGAGPCAFISCIASSVDSGNHQVAQPSAASDVLIAGCNFGATPNGGNGDWAIRFSGTSRVVMVDCFFEAQSLQPVIRRTASSHFFAKRVATFNAGDAEAFSDVPTNSGSYILTDCYLYDCVSYFGQGSGTIRFGGYNASATNRSAIWRVYNHTYYSTAANSIDDNRLATIEGAALNDGDWQYRLGTPDYRSWDGVTHPGWPQRIGYHGAPMAVSNPYDL